MDDHRLPHTKYRLLVYTHSTHCSTFLGIWPHVIYKKLIRFVRFVGINTISVHLIQTSKLKLTCWFRTSWSVVILRDIMNRDDGTHFLSHAYFLYNLHLASEFFTAIHPEAEVREWNNINHHSVNGHWQRWAELSGKFKLIMFFTNIV